MNILGKFILKRAGKFEVGDRTWAGFFYQYLQFPHSSQFINLVSKIWTTQGKILAVAAVSVTTYLFPALCLNRLQNTPWLHQRISFFSAWLGHEKGGRDIIITISFNNCYWRPVQCSIFKLYIIHICALLAKSWWPQQNRLLHLEFVNLQRRYNI